MLTPPSSHSRRGSGKSGPVRLVHAGRLRVVEHADPPAGAADTHRRSADGHARGLLLPVAGRRRP
ncbi:hypothetical protein [Arthrobacter ruber]|uniref:hypothetical protein n=1 Tax=Arthrobacter ruber TaxID=1258893 RepID=UPI0012FFF3A9|nr:hypothetical protein [Arthrobacter ruber]